MMVTMLRADNEIIACAALVLCALSLRRMEECPLLNPERLGDHTL